MKNLGKVIEYMKKDLYSGPDNELKYKDCAAFFKSSILNLAISFEVGEGHFKSEPISYEKICLNIPKKIGSRSSIQSVLNQAVELGFFQKEKSNLDKRVKKYVYSQTYEKMITDGIYNAESVFSENLQYPKS